MKIKYAQWKVDQKRFEGIIFFNHRQKYSYRRLLALGEDGEQYVDSFRWTPNLTNQNICTIKMVLLKNFLHSNSDFAVHKRESWLFYSLNINPIYALSKSQTYKWT